MPLHHEGLIPLRLDSRVILYNGSDTSGYSLHESYAVKGGPPVTEEISEWHPRYGAPGNVKLFSNVAERRSNLRGAVVRYSWFHNPPFVRFVENKSDFVGFYVDLFEELKAQGGNSI